MGDGPHRFIRSNGVAALGQLKRHQPSATTHAGVVLPEVIDPTQLGPTSQRWAGGRNPVGIGTLDMHAHTQLIAELDCPEPYYPALFAVYGSARFI
jgi:hypothetical protein